MSTILLHSGEFHRVFIFFDIVPQIAAPVLRLWPSSEADNREIFNYENVRILVVLVHLAVYIEIALALIFVVSLICNNRISKNFAPPNPCDNTKV